jgi:NADPH:quinone reductase-like Zn-dependent oxidoreductase/acyl carrier protein
MAHAHFQTLRVEGAVERYAGIFSPERNWYLREHRLFGVPTFPSTAYLELAYSVAVRHAGRKAIELRDVFFFNPFSVALGEEREVELVLTAEAEGAGAGAGDGIGAWSFVIRSRDVEAGDESGRKAPPTVSETGWMEHCNGRVVLAAAAVRATHDLVALAASCGEREILNDVSKYENDLTQVVRVGAHLELGSRWNHVRRMAFGPDRQWVEQEMPAARVSEVSETGLHPAMMDFTALLPTQATAVYVPFSYGVVRSHAPLPAKIRTFVTNRDDPRSGKETVVFDAVLMDEHGRALVDIEGMTMRRIDQVKKAAFDAVKAQDAGVGSSVGAESGRKAPPTVAEDGGYRLGLKAPGVLSDLAIQPREREKPGAGMIEIEVCAAGLNFKDVLRALGMMGGSPDGDVAQGFGTECAGRVSAIGEGVTGVAVGDEVMAIAPASFAGYALTTAKMAVPIPRGLTFEQAAGIPLVFLTAYHALVDQGRLAAGERVLIHAAAGGIGLAAIQIAQKIGAEIYATAGAAQKHEYLRALGVEKIASSRSLAFADDVAKWTGGEGVDVVLNSLSGEFIGKSVGVLKPYGRFVEIGARDIYGNSQLGLRPFANNLSFAAVDLGPMFLQRADYVRGMFIQIAEHLATGAYRPLPVTVFPLARASEAFEYMAAAKQIGKIVLQVRAATRRVSAASGAAVGAEGEAAVRHDLSEAILPSEGVEALKRILAGGLPQVVVTARALGQMIEGQKQTAKLIASATTAAAAPVAARVLHPRPVLGTTLEPARNDTEKALVEIWRQLLGIDEVGVHDNFFELGGDSLIGVQVLSRIKKDFAVQLPSSALYEGPTVAQFAEAVEAAKGAAV